MVVAARRGRCITLLSMAIIAIMALGGCSTMGSSSSYHENSQEQRLIDGIQVLRTGDLRHSHDLFEQVVKAPPLVGVTDEALFRLALLQLAEDEGRGGTSRTQPLLELLQKEYPQSPWTPQATILLTWLGDLKSNRERDRERISHLIRENRELLRENRELRQNIERLKNIDLDIERKRSRP